MNSYQYEMSATIEAMLEFAGWAEGAALDHADLAPETINVMLVCLHELVSNVALHARRKSGNPTVKVCLQFAAGQIAVLIEDDGQPFDPLTDTPVRADTDLASAYPGGRGVRIVRQLTSAISYKRSGEWNCLRLEIAARSV